MNLHILHPVKSRTATSPGFLAELSHFAPELVVHLKDHGQIKFRPIRADDEQRMIQFHEALSEESIYLRYFEHISLDTRTLHERLARVCTNTPDSFAIVAERHASGHRPTEIEAVGRLTTSDTPCVAGFAMLINDKFQNTELPRELLKRLIAIARAQGFHTLNGELLVADHDALNLCRSFGFNLLTVPEDGIVLVSYPL
jgi:acetyltransferase